MQDKSLLKQILEASRDVWDRPGTRPAVRRNFAEVLDCGTRALGWEVYASDTDEKRCYHRCDRIGPTRTARRQLGANPW